MRLSFVSYSLTCTLTLTSVWFVVGGLVVYGRCPLSQSDLTHASSPFLTRDLLVLWMNRQVVVGSAYKTGVTSTHSVFIHIYITALCVYVRVYIGVSI